MLNPRLEALYQLGLNYMQQNLPQQALPCFRAINLVTPDFVPAWYHRVLTLIALNELSSALIPIRKALALSPHDQDILKTAIHIGLSLGCFSETLQWLQQLQDLDGTSPWPDLQRVDLYKCLGDFTLAEQALQRAASKGMDAEDVELKRCELLREQGINDALASRLEALSIQFPDFPEARLMLAKLQLANQDYEAGWPNYQARLELAGRPILRNYPWRYWQGEPLQDKAILVYAEQELGEELLFTSCLPDLLKLTLKVTFVCDERLAVLFEHSFPGIKTLRFAEVPQLAAHDLQSIDYCVAIGSLPLHFRQSATDFPAHTGYLQVPDDWIATWREKLNELGGGLKIGIAWQGGLMRTGRLTRSLQPEQLIPLLELPNIQFINIQHGKVRRELKWLAEKHNLPISTWPLDAKNISELAGLVSALDLIITPCCSLVHLAGALGKPVWVMTPKVAAWRYLNEGETMPWYPSARLFRQPEAGDWASVVELIRQQLLTLPTADAGDH